MVSVTLVSRTMQRIYRVHTDGDINTSQWHSDEQTSF